MLIDISLMKVENKMLYNVKVVSYHEETRDKCCYIISLLIVSGLSALLLLFNVSHLVSGCSRQLFAKSSDKISECFVACTE